MDDKNKIFLEPLDPGQHSYFENREMSIARVRERGSEREEVRESKRERERERDTESECERDR